MTYPKPLSEKTLEKRYKESGLNAEARSFLHKLFSACANLYGVTDIRGVWKIYQHLEDVPKLRRKDILAFSAIARREVQPYYIFEIEELYSEEPHNELDRHIVHKDLVGNGYGKLIYFYHFMQELDDKPYCIPKDMLSYAEPTPSTEEIALRTYLSGLRSTATECRSKYGKSVPNDHKGKKLSKFSFLNADERFEAEWLKKRPSALAAFMEDVSVTEDEKIMHIFERAENIGHWNPNKSLQYLFDELNEAGVEMTEKQVEKLLGLVMDFHNNSRLWCLKGWTPKELSNRCRPSIPKAISFGPGIQQAFAEGSIDKEEWFSQIRQMGLEVIE